MYTTILNCPNCRNNLIAYRDRKRLHKSFSKIVCSCSTEMTYEDLPYYKIIPAHELDTTIKNPVAHLMTDIETLSVPYKGKFNCQILTIAIVPMGILFNQIPNCYIKINPKKDDRFYQDEKTLTWWNEQNEKTKNEAFSGTMSHEQAADVLLAYWDLCKQKIIEINSKRALSNLKPFPLDIGFWGNGNDFDNSIISSWLEILERPVPWTYWNSHSMRTALFLNPQLKRVFPSDSESHNALKDAICQAKSINQLL